MVHDIKKWSQMFRICAKNGRYNNTITSLLFLTKGRRNIGGQQMRREAAAGKCTEQRKNADDFLYLFLIF